MKACVDGKCVILTAETDKDKAVLSLFRDSAAVMVAGCGSDNTTSAIHMTLEPVSQDEEDIAQRIAREIFDQEAIDSP